MTNLWHGNARINRTPIEKRPGDGYDLVLTVLMPAEKKLGHMPSIFYFKYEADRIAFAADKLEQGADVEFMT